jgi:hypothetical protein
MCCGVRTALDSPKVRVPLWVAICSVALLLPAWSAASPQSGPARCSATDTRRNNVVRTDSYLRWCGPARAVVYLNGKTYRIRGGSCLPRQSTRLKKPRQRLDGIAIGFMPRKEGMPPGRTVSFGGGGWPATPSTHAQAITIDDSEIQVPGAAVAASGIAVVGKKLNGGWFSLYGRDNSGPTGPLVSGSWTCN